MTRFFKGWLPPKLRHRLGCWSAQYTEWRLNGFFPWEKVTVFDVGANNGNTYSRYLQWLPRATFYAFEPTPELIEELRKIESRFSNYHVIPKAVGDVSGATFFNVAGFSEDDPGGCSSLLEFNGGLEKTWPGRKNFFVSKRIEVQVIRLDDFIRQNKIDRVDFLHIDVQGMDLNVLRSLGTEIKRVRAGVMEVPQSNAVMLYKNQHTREGTETFLAQNGFIIHRVVSQQNEDNLYFRRAD
jgi:FkbM family methyltransferase